MPLLRTPDEAIAWANGQSRWAPHSCLNFVKNAYYGDNPTQNSIDGKPYLSNAIDAWNNSTDKHYDRNPPVGALMYFAGAHPGDPGDVQVYTGNDKSRRTDVGAWGVVGTTSAWWMEYAIGRQYLGWTGDILGFPYFGADAAPLPNPVVTIADRKRKTVEIIPIGDDIYVVDHGQRTKWNVITGLASVEEAVTRIKWLQAQGYKLYPKQKSNRLAGYRTI